MTIYDAVTRTKISENLEPEYRSAEAWGKLHLGSTHLFFRSGLKTFAVEYSRVTRCYRRVMLVPMRLCCGRGELQVENLVLHTAEGEIAQIQLADTATAKKALEKLKKHIPDAEFSCPPKSVPKKENTIN